MNGYAPFSKPFFTSKVGGLNRLDWVGMLRFRHTDPDKCDEHLAKAKWSIAKGLIDPIGVIDVVDVVEDATDN